MMGNCSCGKQSDSLRGFTPQAYSGLMGSEQNKDPTGEVFPTVPIVLTALVLILLPFAVETINKR